MKKIMYLRRATAADVDLFFSWTNEVSTRANSYNNTPVPYDNHIQWFLQKITNPNTYMYVLCEDTDIAVGQIRFDVDNTLNEAIISYAIGEQHRGKKYGSIILEQGINTFLHDYGQKITIVGFVKEENLASKYLFSKLGFTALVADNLPKSIKFVL
ncbi:MAG: GNAT family N-acetyltransferase [Sphingobacteriales bacterium]|nr:GNAT family N-acetyltransferase [Sphingobacteriales bacterium]